ncbi:MAG: hypothetical protein FWD78_04315 [Treponema sp.]|nr:hypothetical protein [Treponema sp.]
MKIIKTKYGQFRKALYAFALLPVFIILTISCSTSPLPRQKFTTVPQDFFGIVHAGSSGTDEEYRLLDDMGAVWMLQTFYWSGIEKEQGKFDYSWYDTYVDNAVSRGKKVIACLGYENHWIFKDGKTKRVITKENILYFLNFVEKTVKRYSGKVSAWEIWNEPNWWVFWKGSDNEFFELLKQTAQRIRKTDPGAYIIGGAFWRVPDNFIRGMYKYGAMENLDGLAFHPYAVNPQGALRLHDTFNKILSEINYKGDVWITEVGYPTSGWYPTAVSQDEFPSYIVKTIAGAAARGARMLSWYQLADAYNEGQAPRNFDSELFFGLVYPDWTKKKGAWAYQLCANWLPGTFYSPELIIREKIPKSLVSYFFWNQEQNVLILWNEAETSCKVRITVSSLITIHNISGDSRSVVPDGSVLEIGGEPVFITWEGGSLPALSPAN